jgi:hypothetical protein
MGEPYDSMLGAPQVAFQDKMLRVSIRYMNIDKRLPLINTMTSDTGSPAC